MSKNLIVKDNALINASYNLDLIEQRLILLAIALSRRTGQELTTNTKLQISVSDYIDTYSIQGRSVYENIKKACKTLFERQFTYFEKQEKGVRIATSRWVSEIAYNDETTAIDMTFAPSVVPFITLLERHFTSYDLEQVAELNSKYAIRLYEIVIAWKSNGRTNQISVEQLRERLGLLDDEYKEMHNFKSRVLDASIKEINEKTDITISYEQHKNGRKIIGFTFTIKQKSNSKKPKSLDQKDPNTIDIFDNLTDTEREIITQKNAYADQIGATAEHRENLINQALEKHRQAEQRAKEQKERKKAERLAQEQQDKEQLELAQRQFEQILNNDRLINAYIANNNLNEKNLQGMQRMCYQQGDFREVFRLEKYKFEQLHYLKYINLKFLEG